ncbi:MAG: lipase [Chloroflexales bacterium]|nr:lipase [Chloroflexales bacterium]
MARLVALGDSLTQGFQSGAIFRTEWSYPAMIARALGLNIPLEFRVPRFPGSGLPLNIEAMLRRMAASLGPDVSLGEWLLQFPMLLNQFVDEVEDLYERGAGAGPAAYGGVYHNLSVWGFRVADCYSVSAGYARQAVANEEGAIIDDFLGLPSAPMYRTACRVLNPRQRPEREGWTMIDNLRQILAEDPDGIESLIVWIGANDCLSTVLELKVKPMGDSDIPDDPQARRQWNLTHPTIFAQDFRRLTDQIAALLPEQTQVFVGTIPHVTIPPVTQGIPPFDGTYFAYYGRFFANPSNFRPLLHSHLTGTDAQFIDQTIDRYNESIRQAVTHQGARWHLVDLGGILDQLAVKRNQAVATPDRPLRDYYAGLGITDHPLLHLSPVPNVLRLGTRELGERYAGGLFSLDCFHPSTIGYGIVAEAILLAMQAAQMLQASPLRLNWQEIIEHDTLLQSSPSLWDDIIDAAEHNALFWDAIFRAIT